MMIAVNLSDNILLGRKCFYCGNYGLYRLHDKRLKCRRCKAYYSLAKLRKDLRILTSSTWSFPPGKLPASWA